VETSSSLRDVMLLMVRGTVLVAARDITNLLASKAREDTDLK
jgi:hypothetical protein